MAKNYLKKTESPIKSEDKNKFPDSPAEYIEILLKTCNIDISYKQVYRTFFGGLSISTLLSSIVLLLYFVLLHSFDSQKLLVLILLFVLFIFSTFAAKKLTEEVNSIENLVNELPNFLKYVKNNYPEEVYQNIFKKWGKLNSKK